mmetsp:Transcript_19164/g.34678  ORF Transcript_19164/g.34678 Transcript_19164/m.34678 type:complete len:186 (-) Transcript_19164:119-676(-)
MSNSILQIAWNNYLKQLRHRPISTKALTAGTIAGASDVIAQLITKGRYDNFRRTFALFCFGASYSGPSAHLWQNFLEIVFQGRRDFATALQKMVIDQLLYGPFCNFMFLGFTTLFLEGRSLTDFVRKIKTDFFTIQRKAWKVWPLAALINYKVVPVQFRVLVINLVALLWTTILIISSKISKKIN